MRDYTNLTQEYLNECFDYNPMTGEFSWRARPDHHFKNPSQVSRWNKMYAGRAINYISDTGYPVVTLHNKSWKIHRLIWIMTYGSIPEGMSIDHKDRNKQNNRLSNLRLCSRHMNARNRPKMNRPASSQYKGVFWDNTNQKYCARYLNKHIGFFDCEVTAARAYDQEVLRLNDGFSTTNFTY